VSKTQKQYGATTDGWFCMTCGRDADPRTSDEGYSQCCNDRITQEPAEHPDHDTTTPNEETAMPTTKTTKPAEAPEFKLNTTTTKALVAYLAEYVSAEADAPHRGLPFIDAKDNVRVKPDHFEQWFLASGLFDGVPSKRARVRALLKDAGLVQKVYPLSAHPLHPELRGKSFGLYTGPVPAGAKKLPHRIVERKAPVAKSEKARVAEISGAMAEDAVTDPTRGPAAPAIERAAASSVRVGDVVGTTRSDTRAAVTAAEGVTGATTRERGNGTAVVAAITEGPGGRVQLRDAESKMIRSCDPDTQVWVRRA
jgi:hypothetical protein